MYDVEHRTRFEHQLNETYSTFAEPLHEIKLKYLCAVHDGSKWCRGEIVGIQTNSNTSMVSVSYEVYLLDYGHTVHVEKENICILKCAHSIKPFVLKCQLSILNKESELAPKERQTICKVLKRLSKYAKKALIYYNGLIPKKSDTYDVLLLTDFPTNIKTTDGIYSLHENYGAFNRTKIQFDEKLCEEWCDQIHRITNNVHDDTLQKKIRVHISHIVSPTEIYVKSVAAERSMNKIRKVIDAYVRKVGENDVNVEWAVGDNCLVRMQNWKTKSYLKLWYRGRIMETDTLNRTFIIFLRDYGRRTEAKGNDLMAISKELADCNDAVQKSSLVISQSWLHTSPEHLHKMIAQYESFAISCKSKNGTVLNIELWATNNSPLEIDCLESWDNIGFNMISVAIRESMESFIAKTQHRYKLSMYERSTEYDSGTIGERYFMDDHLSSEDHDMHSSIHLNSISDANTYKSKTNTRKWPPPMPVDKSFVGLVTHITQKGIVYLQEESVISVANDLFVEITNCITRTGARAINKLSWSKGDICFAEFEPDVYHRAVIRRIDREDGTCLVRDDSYLFDRVNATQTQMIYKFRMYVQIDDNNKISQLERNRQELRTAIEQTVLCCYCPRPVG